VTLPWLGPTWALTVGSMVVVTEECGQLATVSVTQVSFEYNLLVTKLEFIYNSPNSQPKIMILRSLESPKTGK